MTPFSSCLLPTGSGRLCPVSWLLLLVLFLCSPCSADDGVANATLYWDGGGPLCQCDSGGIQMPSFACSYGSRGNWSNGLKTFADPTPPNSIITGITAVLYGTLGCDVFTSQVSLLLEIGSMVFANPTLVPNLPCFCANCVGGVTVPSNALTTCDYPGFRHNTINTFQVIVDGGNSLCLSQVVLFFNYTVAGPFYGTLEPNSGPTYGQTQVTVHGYVPPLGEEDDLVCVFNSSTFPATFIPPNSVQCLSPPQSQPGNVSFYVTPISNCAGVRPVTSNTSTFQYYASPVVSGISSARGTTKGGTQIMLIGDSFFNASGFGCKIGDYDAVSVFVNSSQIICIAPPGTGSDLHIYLSFNGQQYYDTSFMFTYESPSSFWTASTTSWIILSVSGGAALGLILLFIVLIKSKFKKDGYHQIIEGKQITIDEVRLGPRIGKGNFGEVYKAYWRGAEIAVKKLPAHNMTDQFLKDFHKEVSLMRALRHPNVIQFLGSCTVLPDICICTEYMTRGSLYKILHDATQTLSWALIKKMCVDAAKGCVYLHDCDPIIVHRDLKSHNLLVDENWKVKVCDFGLSTIVEQASRTMTACGTPCWTAPEVLRNQRYTEKADVYSFGIVLWECATRDDPFVGMPPFQVIFAVGREGLRPPLPRVCPADFAKLITDCWDEKPHARPSMKEVLARLENLDTTGWPDISVHNPTSIV